MIFDSIISRYTLSFEIYIFNVSSFEEKLLSVLYQSGFFLFIRYLNATSYILYESVKFLCLRKLLSQSVSSFPYYQTADFINL